MSFDIVKEMINRLPCSLQRTGAGKLTRARAFQLASLATLSVHYRSQCSVHGTWLNVFVDTRLVGENYGL